MQKKWKIFLVILWIVTLTTLHASDATPKTKKYNVTLCALFKNEAPYLKEWIAYHQMIGIDHFLLYDNGSTDHSSSILRPYIAKGIVTLVRWPDSLKEEGFLWTLSTQIPAFENAKIRMKGKTKWLAFLEPSEFLVPEETDNLLETLNKYEETPAVVLGTDCFDASQPKAKWVIETTDMISSDENRLYSVEKTIFQPDHCAAFTCAPYQHVYINQEKPALLPKQQLRVHRYQDRFKGKLFFGKSKNKLQVDNRMMRDDEVEALLEKGYTIEDHRPTVQRFIKNLQKMNSKKRGDQ